MAFLIGSGSLSTYCSEAECFSKSKTGASIWRISAAFKEGTLPENTSAICEPRAG
jgi:hypothetical protein